MTDTIASRVTRVIGGSAHALLDAMENAAPEATMAQAIREVEAAIDEGAGLRVYRYNRDHYIVSETLDADSAASIVFTLDRDPTTNVLNGVTLSCLGPSGPVTQAVPATEPGDNWRSERERLARAYCVRSAR